MGASVGGHRFLRCVHNSTAPSTADLGIPSSAKTHRFPVITRSGRQNAPPPGCPAPVSSPVQALASYAPCLALWKRRITRLLHGLRRTRTPSKRFRLQGQSPWSRVSRSGTDSVGDGPARAHGSHQPPSWRHYSKQLRRVPSDAFFLSIGAHAICGLTMRCGQPSNGSQPK